MLQLKEKFVAIGHITNDTEPNNHLGGGVAYAAVAACRLDHEAHIITKCPEGHPYIQELEQLGVNVHRLPSQESTITTFSNLYDKHGRRTQKVLETQKAITILDFNNFPKSEILQNALILVAPVVGEVDVNLFPLLSTYGTLAITPQGYYRHIDEKKQVHQQGWDVSPSALSPVSIAVFSTEDVTLDQKINPTELNKIANNIPLTVITDSEKPSTIYERGKIVQTINSFPLQEGEIVDFTGAGDTFATSFFSRYSITEDIRDAGIYAALYAALKIRDGKGEGIASIPTQQELEVFVNKNKARTDRHFRQK